MSATARGELACSDRTAGRGDGDGGGRGERLPDERGSHCRPRTSLRATGDLDGARRAAEQSVALVAGARTPASPRWPDARLAMTRRELGERGGDQPMRGAGGWRLPLIPPIWRVRYRRALTRVELEAGRLEAAIACAEAAETDAAALGLPLATAVAERARAAVAARRRANAEPPPRWRCRSAAAATSAGAPIEAARSRVVAGSALAAAGDRDRAVELLRRAEREFDDVRRAARPRRGPPASCGGSARGPSRADRPAPPTAASSRSPGASARWRT